MRERRAGRPSIALVALVIFVALAASFPGSARAESPKLVAPKLVAMNGPGLLGTWSALIDWDDPAGFAVVMTFAPGGRIEERVSTHAGESYALLGTYALARGSLRFHWTDYRPKKVCGASGCLDAPAPAELDSSGYVSIAIEDANHFVGRGPDGRTVHWKRVKATDFSMPSADAQTT